jgi:hypothetical protein
VVKYISCPTKIISSGDKTSDNEVLYIHFRPGTSVNLVDDAQTSQKHLTDLHIGEFKEHLKRLDYANTDPDLFNELMRWGPGKTILADLNLADALRWHMPDYVYSVWLVIDTNSMPVKPGLYKIYARKTSYVWHQPLRISFEGSVRFYDVESIQNISNGDGENE